MTILYHGTSKENANSIRQDGFSLDYSGTGWGSTYGKAIYFTKCYNTAKIYAGYDGEVIKVNIKNINYLKLDRDYSPSCKNNIRKIKSLIMYVKLNSDKNCLITNNENEYIFFKDFHYNFIY